ncbi:hypothetical protein RF11_10705 [Thelohanellus kitauei]|uniref:Tc1-like transposase DDE domain-containing protein n=1 Tax=Thelohanellus kitauei TaxID=669202 RepID=A0A0C2JLG1_THEKT|nr:hypothetical protein RF11_08285 [Thelohanellus kitauei]KII70276.1 hypothetical protein RF11_10705 [Thelohanellus kitauei]
MGGSEPNEVDKQDSLMESKLEQEITPVKERRRSGRKNTKISNENREKIVAKSLEGCTIPEIVKSFKLNYQTVNSILRQYSKTGKICKSQRGGDRRSKLTVQAKEKLFTYVDGESNLTLKQISDWVETNFGVRISLSAIDRLLCRFRWDLKQITSAPENKNCETTIKARNEYVSRYQELEKVNDDKNFIFLDFVEFLETIRPSRKYTRNKYVKVPAPICENIFLVVAMNKHGILYHKIHEQAMNCDNFKDLLRNLIAICAEKDIRTPVLIMDDTRIPRHWELVEDPEMSIKREYLPPYSPFLDPVANVFSLWKNKVASVNPTNKVHLRELMVAKLEEITSGDCELFYQRMRDHFLKCLNQEEINE